MRVIQRKRKKKKELRSLTSDRDFYEVQIFLDLSFPNKVTPRGVIICIERRACDVILSKKRGRERDRREGETREKRRSGKGKRFTKLWN